MPGRKHHAGPDEPRCPKPGCERPAGLFTDTPGVGPCRRHSAPQRSQPVPIESTPEPSPERGETESVPEPNLPDPLARRLTGDGAEPSADPLAVLRRVLVSAREAGYPFGEAWAIGAEAALSYMSERRAREWWDTLTGTERAWADAYGRRTSRLAELAQVQQLE